MKHKLAIIVPVFRNHMLLKQAVQSVLNQTVEDDYKFDLVFIEDGSSDGDRTWNKILDAEREIKTERSSIRVLKNKKIRNEGPGFARTLGVAMTDATYLAYLDVDDLLHRDFVKNWRRQVEDFTPNADLVFWQYYQEDGKTGEGRKLIDPKLACIDTEVSKASQKRRISDSIGITHSMELYNRIGGWPPFMLSGEDMIFCRRLAQAAREPVFADFVSGTKRLYAQRQEATQRRFDSGLYIKLDQEHPNGPAGQYLDDPNALMNYFIKPEDDPEFARRNLSNYTASLVNPQKI